MKIKFWEENYYFQEDNRSNSLKKQFFKDLFWLIEKKVLSDEDWSQSIENLQVNFLKNCFLSRLNRLFLISIILWNLIDIIDCIENSQMCWFPKAIANTFEKQGWQIDFKQIEKATVSLIFIFLHWMLSFFTRDCKVLWF